MNLFLSHSDYIYIKNTTKNTFFFYILNLLKT